MTGRSAGLSPLRTWYTRPFPPVELLPCTLAPSLADAPAGWGFLFRPSVGLTSKEESSIKSERLRPLRRRSARINHQLISQALIVLHARHPTYISTSNCPRAAHKSGTYRNSRSLTSSSAVAIGRQNKTLIKAVIGARATACAQPACDARVPLIKRQKPWHFHKSHTASRSRGYCEAGFADDAADWNVTMTIPHYLNEIMACMRCIKGGWYSMDDSGNLPSGPYRSHEECLRSVPQYKPPDSPAVQLRG
jgi:hypothetical protein